jgi:hypothetical protein
MNSNWFTTDQVRQLVELLTVAAAAPDTRWPVFCV